MNRWIAIACLLISCGIARAQTHPSAPVFSPAGEPLDYTPAYVAPDWQFHCTLSGGLSNLHFNTKSAIPYNPLGGYADLNAYARMPNYNSPIVGLGLTTTGTWDNYTITYPAAPFYRSFTGNAGLFAAEVRIAFPIGLPDPDDGFYISPRLGIGLLVENFSGGQPYYGYPSYPLGAFTNHTGNGYEIRPDIEFGYRVDRFNIGCEASYMAAWGNFGNLGNLLQEFRIGLIVGYRF